MNIKKLFKFRLPGQKCINCARIDPDDGPFCDNVYGENFGLNSEISENFWCKNYVSFKKEYEKFLKRKTQKNI